MDFKELKYQVSEIFYSIQGEGSRAGKPCVFVRMQGCGLRCTWCDTPYALEIKTGGVEMTGSEIIEKVKSYNCNFIEFTGGEPLRQENIHSLMEYFCDKGYTVALETSGNLDVSVVDNRVIKIVDVKCPGSGMSKKNMYKNLEILNPHDEVKFVLAGREDYDFAKGIVEKYELDKQAAAVLFAPVFGSINTEDLAEWILEDRLPVRLQLQMHKFIWGPDKRGV